ncbi:MAG: hypothetical protein WA908_07870, partial [Pontixanthobacter sp.]
MDTETNAPGYSGETRHKKRRRAFWRYSAIAFLFALIAGFLSGVTNELFIDGTIPIAVPLGLLAAVSIAAVWFTIDYFKRIDELDLMDNLWAHMSGLYIGVWAFGVWYIIAQLGISEQPQA